MSKPKVMAQIEDLSVNKANIASPALTGIPKTPTPGDGADTEQITNVAYVDDVIGETKQVLEESITYHDEQGIEYEDFDGKINAEQVIGLASVATTGVLVVKDDTTLEQYEVGINNGKLYIRKKEAI